MIVLLVSVLVFKAITNGNFPQKSLFQIKFLVYILLLVSSFAQFEKRAGT